jgi:hypothetical protein
MKTLSINKKFLKDLTMINIKEREQYYKLMPKEMQDHFSEVNLLDKISSF